MADDRSVEGNPAEELDFSAAAPQFVVPPPTVNVLDALALPDPGAVGLPSSPEYLRYNVRGRSWHERMFYNAGTMYMLGATQRRDGEGEGEGARARAHARGAAR